jgi:hypothetical protein
MAVDTRLNAMVIAGEVLADYLHAYDTWRELDELPTHPSDVEEAIISLRCNEAWDTYEKMRKHVEHLLTAGIEATRKD